MAESDVFPTTPDDETAASEPVAAEAADDLTVPAEAAVEDWVAPADAADDLMVPAGAAADAPQPAPPADLDDALADAEASGQRATRVLPPQTTRARMPSLPVGLLLIALGVILVWPVFSGGYILVPAAIAAIVTVGVALSLLVHWLSTGRRARGALFVALALLMGGLLTGVFVLQPASADLTRFWPLYVVGLGGALLLTFLGDRRRDRRFMLPGLILAVGGLVALVMTLGQLPAGITDFARQAWPWVLVLLALGLLPLAIQRMPEED
ncbi:MAG: hypothetical protein JW910_04060 [Anaerolineae bacterium]|nr:hypothetical protein [Anaerolineae bacterium]